MRFGLFLMIILSFHFISSALLSLFKIWYNKTTEWKLEATLVWGVHVLLFERLHLWSSLRGH